MTGGEICFIAAAQASPGFVSGLSAGASALAAAYTARQQTNQAQEQTRQTEAVVCGLVAIGLIGGVVLLGYLSSGRAGIPVLSA